MSPAAPGETLIPLFPLGTVLFPGGPLPLRIFERRYLDMVSRCLKEDLPFGVCLIRSGQEVGRAAVPHDIGTLARIADWHRYDDGVLGVTAVGVERFRIRHREVGPDDLVSALVERLEEPVHPLPPEHRPLAEIARHLTGRVAHAYEGLESRPGDAGWVGYRLAELLPLPPAQKQHLLELEDPLVRLQALGRIVELIREGEGGPAPPRC